MCKGMGIVIKKEERADENRKTTEKTTENILSQNIRNLIGTMKFSAKQTMNALKAPIAD